MKVRFKELTTEQKEFISQTYLTRISHDEKIEILTDRFGVKGRTIRTWWNKLGITTINSRRPKQIGEAMSNELRSSTDVVFVTMAQNRTLVNKNMFNYMKYYKKFLEEEKGKKVQIVVIPTTYHNPTRLTDDPKATDWWAAEIDPYLHYNKVVFGDCLIHTSFRVRPTARLPLTGLELLAGGRHLVIGHPRVHFKTLPRFRGDDLYTLSTTGSLTYKNYSDSKAGELGESHHTYGFSVIEKGEDDKCMVPRNVKCNVDGTFTDIMYEVGPEGVKTVDSSKGFVWGDIHHMQLDYNVYEKTVDLVNKLNPEVNILHDVLDAGSKGLNPHESKDMYILKKKIRNGEDDIFGEVSDSLEFLKELHEDTNKSKIKVVYSNHDYFLDRYINDFNWKSDLHNSGAYLHFAMIQQTKNIEEHGCIFGYLVNNMEYPDIQYLRPEEKFSVGEYICSLHGDFGSNGAKGSPNTLKKLNYKTITAHTHSPQIVDGNTVVGVSAKLDQYYTRRGLSSWAHAHSVIHNTGKNQLLVMNNNYKISTFI